MKSLAAPNATPTVLPVIRVSKNEEKDVQLPKKDAKFWLIFTSMCICVFLSALELSSISPAVPAIANALHASENIWVGSAYALSSTAFIPMSGGLAQSFGRRPTFLLTIGVFALGSGICGAANSMNMLIAGRVIQGLGGGAIQSLTGIILADLITLQERGLYGGFYGLTWCIGTSIGPVIGGSLASQRQWRWLFYLNLFVSLVAWGSVILLLDLPTPPGSYREKITRMDWIGNFLAIASTVLYTIALTWAGIIAPWGSAKVLVPLVLGLVGLVVFIAYEATLATNPLVPSSLMTNMTSISGYIQLFCSFIIISAVLYYFPVYFMACKGKSSMVSGLYTIAFVSLAPGAILVGFSVKVTGRYRPQMWIGWAITIIALGLMSALLAKDPSGKSIGYLVLLGWASGMLAGTALYPVQAPLSVSLNAQVFAFVWFLRSFASVLGITIGSTVIQKELIKKLPASLVKSVPEGTAIIYALISVFPSLPHQIRSEVEVASADSLALLWKVLAIIGSIGFVASFFMRAFPLHNRLDAEWALKSGKVAQSARLHAQRTANGLLGVPSQEVLDISAAAIGATRRSRAWIPSFQFRADDFNTNAMLLELSTSGFL